MSGDTVTESDKSPDVTGPIPQPETVTTSDSPPLRGVTLCHRGEGEDSERAFDCLSPQEADFQTAALRELARINAFKEHLRAPSPCEQARACATATCRAPRPATITAGWSVDQQTGEWRCPVCTGLRWPSLGRQ